MNSELLIFYEESLDKKFMDKALKTIRDNYQNPDFDVTEFIDTMGISRSLLHKKLTKLAGRFIRIYSLNVLRKLMITNKGNPFIIFQNLYTRMRISTLNYSNYLISRTTRKFFSIYYPQKRNYYPPEW